MLIDVVIDANVQYNVVIGYTLLMYKFFQKKITLYKFNISEIFFAIQPSNRIVVHLLKNPESTDDLHLVIRLWSLIYAIRRYHFFSILCVTRCWQDKQGFNLFGLYKFLTYHHFTNFISQESFYPITNQCKLLNINLFRNNKTNIIDR